MPEDKKIFVEKAVKLFGLDGAVTDVYCVDTISGKGKTGFTLSNHTKWLLKDDEDNMLTLLKYVGHGDYISYSARNRKLLKEAD